MTLIGKNHSKVGGVLGGLGSLLVPWRPGRPMTPQEEGESGYKRVELVGEAQES